MSSADPASTGTSLVSMYFVAESASASRDCCVPCLALHGVTSLAVALFLVFDVVVVEVFVDLVARATTACV